MDNLKHWIIAIVLLAAIVGTAILVNLDNADQEVIRIYKATEFSSKTAIQENKSSQNQPDVLVDDASTTSQEPETVSEQYSDDSDTEGRTDESDISDLLDDLSGVSGEIEVEKESEVDDKLAYSPFGFGKFPDVPKDFPRQDVWEFLWKLYDKDPQAAENYELINRVVVGLWQEGGRSPGGVLKNGKVYPLDDNTAYITWKTSESPDGTEVRRYISNLTTTPAIARRYRDSHFRNGLIPPGINVIEHSEGGYDPRDFINQ